MKLVVYIYMLLGVLLFACGGSVNENQVLKSDSVKTNVKTSDTAKTKGDTVKLIEQEVVLNDIPATKDVKERLKYFRDKYAINYTEQQNNNLKIYVLDRFGCDKKYKLVLQKNMPVAYGEVQNIFPIANIRVYTYADSAQQANAVNNWLNCFGNDCNQIKKGEPTMIKSTPGYYIINQNEIICLDYALEHNENNWNEMIKHLNALFANRKSIKIRVKNQGKLFWE